MSSSKDIELKVDCFGTVEHPITKKRDGITKFTWENKKNKMSVSLLSYGAIIQSIKVPDRSGNLSDVVMGFDDVAGYRKTNNPYFGAFVGRVANRIAHGEFTLNGEVVKVSKNRGTFSLHGGFIGFDKFNFNHYIDGNVVYLSHVSPDGWEGYPGDVLVTVKCELLSNNSIAMEYQATTTKPTPINLTNHSYFNLAGHETGYEEVYKHVIHINADKITETDANSIPTGKLINVAGTPYDLRIAKELGPAMNNLSSIGYDNNFCVNIPQGSHGDLVFVARAIHPPSGRYLEVHSNQPGVQLYTANFLPDPCGNINPATFVSENYYEVDGVLTTKLEQVDIASKEKKALPKCPDETAVAGKGGVHYLKHGSFCLETQKFPDAVHHDNFPSVILKPGDVYKHAVVFKFGVDSE